MLRPLRARRYLAGRAGTTVMDVVSGATFAARWRPVCSGNCIVSRDWNVVVATLAITGSVSFLAIAGWPLPPAAFQSPWWWLLAMKLLLFLGMLGLAAANRFRLAPGMSAGHQSAARRIRASIEMELVMLLLILALVAWLGMLAPDPG